MKKFLNSVDTILSESLAGFASAHSDLVTLDPSGKFVRRNELKPGAGPVMNRCMAVLSVLACLMRPARDKCLPRRHPTR